MKFRDSLTFQLGTIIAGILVVMLAITSIATYKTAYDKLYDAAGIEAYGCANITTGLIRPDEMEKAMAGDLQTQDEIGKTLNWTTDHKDIFETQYILDLDGNLIALDDNLKSKGFKPGDAFHMDKKAVDDLLAHAHPSYSEPYEFGGMKRLSGYAPIHKDHDPSKEIIAVSVIDFDADIVKNRTWDVVRDGILISIIPMLLASIVTGFLIRRKTKPISSLIVQAKKIADGDLAVETTTVHSNDEVGDLARTLNRMTVNLQEMIGTMNTTSHQLSENSNETSSSLNEMREAVSMVANSIEEVATAVTDGTTTAESATEILTNLANDLRSTKEDADAMLVNSNETMNIALEGAQRANEISRDMELIRTGSQEVGDTIQNLVESTTKIQDITGSIAGIAAQTNLLALNAYIEAARAGEHGKGFAVVADEVRNLASKSAEASKNTAALIEATVQSVQEGTGIANRTAESLDRIVLSSEESAKLVQDISKASQDQAASIAQVTVGIDQISSVVHTNSATSEESAAASQELSNQAQFLMSLVKQFKIREA